MSRAIAVLAGLVVMLAVAGGLVYLNKDSHLVLEGEIKKVRIQPLTNEETLMVVDFRAANKAGHSYEVRSLDLVIEDKQGRIAEGVFAHEGDLTAAFQYYTALGPKYNPALRIGLKIPAKATSDYMVGVDFRLPPKILEDRAKLTLRVTERDGISSEIVETPQR